MLAWACAKRKHRNHFFWHFVGILTQCGVLQAKEWQEAEDRLLLEGAHTTT